MIRLFLEMVSAAKTPSPWTADRLRTIFGNPERTCMAPRSYNTFEARRVRGLDGNEHVQALSLQCARIDVRSQTRAGDAEQGRPLTRRPSPMCLLVEYQVGLFREVLSIDRPGDRPALSRASQASDRKQTRSGHDVHDPFG